MFNLVSVVYTFISATIVGIFIVAALVLGYDTLTPLLIVIVAGFVVALPVSYFVAKAMSEVE
jgi:hypothetical protein